MLAGLRSDWRRARSATWLERRLLLEAVVFLALARASVRLLPFQKTMRLFGLRPAAGSGEPSVSSEPEAVQRATWAVRAAAARVPSVGNCLAQALAGSAMLRRRGIATVVQLGVAIAGSAPPGMAAHAWLRCGSSVLTGGIGSGSFTPVAAFDVGTGRRPRFFRPAPLGDGGSQDRRRSRGAGPASLRMGR